MYYVTKININISFGEKNNNLDKVLDQVSSDLMNTGLLYYTTLLFITCTITNRVTTNVEQIHAHKMK